jgi:integrase
MGRQKREYVVGDFWLARREESPFWQINWYDEEGRTTRHRSTRCERLEDAIPVIIAHEQAERAKGRQPIEEARAVPLLMLYWEEHGRRTINHAQTASSLRQFIGFLMQDKASLAVTVKDLTPDVFRRFVRWRTRPHSYALRWQGRDYAHSSPGVAGESVQRNLDDVRAALNHHVSEGRLLFAPKVPSVGSDMRSPARDVTLTLPQLGSIVAYALNDIEALRWILGMLATAARPDAVLRWDIEAQWRGGLLDTHPAGAPRTKKRNAVVPVIEPFAPWLEAWQAAPHPIVRSRKTWWRTMRAALDLPADVVPKTVRHTVATELRARGVPQLDVEGLLGHLMSNRVTAVYAKYDPARLSLAKQQLSAIWREVWAEAFLWLADHYRTTSPKGAAIVVARKTAKC